MYLLKQDIYPYYGCMYYFEMDKENLCLALVEPNGILSTNELHVWFVTNLGNHFYEYLSEHKFNYIGIYFLNYFLESVNCLEHKVNHIVNNIRKHADNYPYEVIAFRDCHSCDRIAVLGDPLPDFNHISLKKETCSACSHLFVCN